MLLMLLLLLLEFELVKAFMKEECCEEVNEIPSLSVEIPVKEAKVATELLLLHDVARALEPIKLDKLAARFEGAELTLSLVLVLDVKADGGGEVAIGLFKSGIEITAPVDCIIDLKLQFDLPAIKE